jgi:uncharacterized membrane protein
MWNLLAWLAIAGGFTAAAAALYGHYRVLPSWMTGPDICRLEDGGCAVLFRSPRASLLGVPNAGLGLLLYLLLAAGLIMHWPSWLLLAMTLPAVAMSAFLGRSLIVNGHQCRICWTGHWSNAVLFLLLLARTLSDLRHLSG